MRFFPKNNQTIFKTLDTGLLIFLVAVMFMVYVACTNSNDGNPAAPDPVDQVAVYLYLNQSGSSTKIYSDGRLVSYLQYKLERDTITVENGAQLKARIYKDAKFIYKTTTAAEGLLWTLP